MLVPKQSSVLHSVQNGIRVRRAEGNVWPSHTHGQRESERIKRDNNKENSVQIV